MHDRLKALLTDTLAKRLLWLMWVALVASHLLAFGFFLLTHDLPPGGPHLPPPREHAQGVSPLPTFPSLPPTPGLTGGPQLSTQALVLDYAIRLLVIALAAWAGARWLTRPLRRLVQASAGLAEALRRGRHPERLDENDGTREVRALAQEFNRMSTQLQRQYEARALMVAAISHDLRTPLTRLRMRLDTIEDSATLRERAVADLREMNALIDSVLQVFRPQQSEGEALQRIELGALLQALADDRAEQGEAVRFAGGHATVAARPLALRRVLDNLVGNALRYGQQAELSLAPQPDGGCLLHIDDRGPGIPPELLEAVFEPFVRVEGSRQRSTGGTGLGLHIARSLCEGMDVGLSLHNRPEGGLRATLRFR
ncbi:MAG: ATP-binding protein [Inhella sp.]